MGSFRPLLCVDVDPGDPPADGASDLVGNRALLRDAAVQTIVTTLSDAGIRFMPPPEVEIIGDRSAVDGG